MGMLVNGIEGTGGFVVKERNLEVHIVVDMSKEWK